MFFFFFELQANTQNYGRRPFAVGLLIAGYDVIFLKIKIILNYLSFNRIMVHTLLSLIHLQMLLKCWLHQLELVHKVQELI